MSEPAVNQNHNQASLAQFQVFQDAFIFCFFSRMNFEEFEELDHRLLKATSDLYQKATLVQQSAIPLFLKGKDILCRARTGSGKTLAFSLPILQKILSTIGDSSAIDSLKALILVPTRELSTQIESYLKKLSKYCDIKIVNIAQDTSLVNQQQLLKSNKLSKNGATGTIYPSELVPN